ncbi:YggS family pyridoxal phosphate-dependent enzyme [Peribacillus deserti]|uniref:Pyridoxal phosphate homeostasis protein n=1 Tax=Peribacillus deserti TaxID=673318 RepID=A0A2N5M7A6_9BACI|nr:YggS family pyridoxal phosphate-dependent enzyme [Peribacillus deserti]PLT30240.1 YggS family pyridoxal phosphate-dependent enzyme [Peribacillus deserti]
MRVTDNLKTIQEKINDACRKSGRNPEEVKLVAVTKYVSVERAQEALEAGVVHLGENRDEGLLAKWEVLKDRPVWHFIGSLQTRKVKSIIDVAEYIHSLDRLSLADEIQKRAVKPIKCFIQVNVSGEESKHGMSPSDVLDFIRAIKSHDKIIVEGLMTMAPLTDDEDRIRNCFKELKSLREKIQQLSIENSPCKELSMGMSNDFHIAIEEGATFIRIGTALVG